MTAPTLIGAHYQVESLADGVFFARARSEGTALANSGIVDLGGTTLVFDTGMTLRAAKELRTAALTVTRRPLGLVAISHRHLDHLLGNQVFTDRPIYATRRTIEVVRERRAIWELELAPARIQADLRELEGEGREHLEASPSERLEYEGAIRVSGALLSEAAERSFTPPTVDFREELQLPGDRGARLVTFGGGHTESDALLHLPREGIVFAGDLVVHHAHPNVVDGSPEEWIRILGEVDRLRPETVAGGHGGLATRETVHELVDYLASLVQLAQQGGKPPIPARFSDWDGPGQFERNLAHLRAAGTRPSPPA